MTPEKKLEKAKDLINRLKEELEYQWEANHDEHCTNMKNCESFGHTRECWWPRPPILDEKL